MSSAAFFARRHPGLSAKATKGTLRREMVRDRRMSFLIPRWYHVFASDDLPVQLKAATEATGINWDYLPWFWRLRDNDA